MTEGTPTAKDLGAVFDAHVKAEFVDMDVAATMATIISNLPANEMIERWRLRPK
jgi:hypothetical protein